jgi:hypothetical protein
MSDPAHPAHPAHPAPAVAGTAHEIPADLAPAAQSPDASKASAPAAQPKKGVAALVGKLKGLAQGAGFWVKSHPLQAGLIGSGVLVGSLLVGWLALKALKNKKNKKMRGHHKRNYDPLDAIFDMTEEEKLRYLAEFDPEDPEFVEFMKNFDLSSITFE